MRFHSFLALLFSLFPYTFFPSLQAQSPFAVVELTDSPRPGGGELLKEFEVKGKPLKGICEYWQVLEEAARQARELGANCLVVDEHEAPKNVGCHRITVRALIIDDPERFEQEIQWHPDRTLGPQNFQAPADNRPSPCGITTTVTYTVTISALNGKETLEVLALFYPRDSYLDLEEDTDYCVSYARLRFDYTEIWARKFFREAMASRESDTDEDTDTRLKKLYRELNSAFLRQLDEIDADLQAHPEHMSAWQQKAKAELTELSPYTDKTGELE